MKVLVTGGAGFIGRFITERLIAEGHRITVLDCLDPQVHSTSPSVLLPDSADLVVGDVRDRIILAKCLKDAHIVVHAAAAVGVAQSLYQVHHYTDVNIGGTALLLELAAEHSSLRKLIVLTSMTSYGEGLYQRLSDRKFLRVPVRTEEQIQIHGWEPHCPETGDQLASFPTPESAELLAMNVYALTKKYQEELSLSLSRTYRLPIVCLRLFNVYGPGQSLSNPYTGVLAIFLSRLLSGQPPVLYEDGQQTRDFVSVHDVVEAIYRVITTDRANGEVLNIGSGRPRSILECATRLAFLSGIEIEPEVTERFRKGDVRHCTASIELARQLIDFQPRVEWEEGLRELVLWAKGAQRKDSFDEAHSELERRGLV